MEENIMNKPLITIPIGDPAGVGPEIVAMALADSKVAEAARCIIVGDRKIIYDSEGYTKSAESWRDFLS